MTRAHYAAETFIKNCLDGPLKPIVGTNYGRKWPRFKTNDTLVCRFYDEVTNGKNVALLDELLAPNFEGFTGEV
jgi:hypothetical protein